MGHDPKAMADVVNLSALGLDAGRGGADLREEVARDRATAQALRDYLHACNAAR